MAEAEYVLARKILKLANRIVSGRNTDIRDLGLTSSQADSLVYFVHNEGRSAVDLKDHLGSDSPDRQRNCKTHGGEESD